MNIKCQAFIKVMGPESVMEDISLCSSSPTASKYKRIQIVYATDSPFPVRFPPKVRHELRAEGRLDLEALGL